MARRPWPTRLLLGAAVLVVAGAAGCPAPSSAPKPSAASAGRGAEARSEVLRYLSAASGSWTVSGQHNREPNDQPARWTEKVHDITGKYPGVWGADLSFHTLANRPFVVAEAQRQWAAGSLVTLMWHLCPPTHPEPCAWNTSDGVWADLTDRQWTELITDGTALNRAFTTQLDAAVAPLRQLRDAGVAVLWRPFHEMNDLWPWWGGRPGPDGSRRLFQLMHDRFAAAGLDNLVWVWDVSDRDTSGYAAYDPGPAYADVVALDVWQADYPSAAAYAAVLGVAAGRPIALGEVSRVPSPSILAEQPRWVWFLMWSEYLVDHNSPVEVNTTYDDPRVRNRDTLSR
jgi:mannan endo-1,4-beta-mannosidase